MAQYPPGYPPLRLDDRHGDGDCRHGRLCRPSSDYPANLYLQRHHRGDSQDQFRFRLLRPADVLRHDQRLYPGSGQRPAPGEGGRGYGSIGISGKAQGGGYSGDQPFGDQYHCPFPSGGV